ncbi:GNAT family acetyltransferase [Paenibacillus sp. D9]|nr:GNAT family acetyltransferase [Paenibacillus sp. D9]
MYAFARLLRSVENMDIHRSPEWALQLRIKLLKACDRLRERLRPTVELRPIDSTNWHACTRLEVTDEQKDVFPVPAVYWLAESAYCGFTPLAMYTDEQLAGFAVYAVDPADGSCWIMAFMLDRKFQGRGLGRSGMKELMRYIEDKQWGGTIKLGHRCDNMRASRLYASLGFAEISRDEREVVREWRFQP